MPGMLGRAGIVGIFARELLDIGCEKTEGTAGPIWGIDGICGVILEHDDTGVGMPGITTMGLCTGWGTPGDAASCSFWRDGDVAFCK